MLCFPFGGRLLVILCHWWHPIDKSWTSSVWGWKNHKHISRKKIGWQVPPFGKSLACAGFPSNVISECMKLCFLYVHGFFTLNCPLLCHVSCYIYTMHLLTSLLLYDIKNSMNFNIFHLKMNTKDEITPKREFYIPNTLHIKHLPTPSTKELNHRPHVFFWYLHGGNLQVCPILGIIDLKQLKNMAFSVRYILLRIVGYNNQLHGIKVSNG